MPALYKTPGKRRLLAKTIQALVATAPRPIPQTQLAASIATAAYLAVRADGVTEAAFLDACRAEYWLALTDRKRVS
jgi:hypothetical protein